MQTSTENQPVPSQKNDEKINENDKNEKMNEKMENDLKNVEIMEHNDDEDIEDDENDDQNDDQNNDEENDEDNQNDDQNEIDDDEELNDLGGNEKIGKVITATRKIGKLVADTAAFIKNIPLQNYSSDIYTVPEVIDEVRDSKAREFLDTFPLSITQLNPSEEDYAFAVNFSRETGDFPALSKTDLKIIALTYMLTSRENKEQVRMKPLQKPEARNDKPEHSNFFNPSSNIGVGKFINDDDGWINSENISEYTQSYNGVHSKESDSEINVACLTTDFALQNVLLQMNLNLLSVDGISIKKVQKWIKRCNACKRLCKELDSLFCPTCGSKSLSKLSYTVDSEGNTFYNLPRRKKNLRGTRYPIPHPKGGRNNKDLILRPDQLPKYGKKEKMIDLESDDFNILGPRKKKGYVAPVVGFGRRNPNVSRKKIGKKQSKKSGF